MKQIAWIIFASLAIITSAHSTGFDCEKAKSKIEKLICSDDDLPTLDDDLNSSYKMATKDKSQANAIRLAQKKWIKERDNCADVDCVKVAYENRIAELTSILESDEFDSGETKSPICLLCGSWNIDSATEKAGKGSHENWDDPIAEVLTVDNTSITIPYCGSYLYKISGSKVIVEDDDTKHHDLSMRLEKIEDSTSIPPCEGENWVLSAEVGAGQGSVSFKMSNASGETLTIDGWNPEGNDPDMGTTAYEGRKIRYDYLRSSKALKNISDEFFKINGNGRTRTFDLTRFRASAAAYCEDFISGGNTSTASGDNVVLECEQVVLDIKIDEFKSWHCESQSSQNSEKSACKFPAEAIRNFCEYDSQPGTRLANLQHIFCPL